MSHGPFIIASYLVAALTLGGMALALALDHRRQKKALERLEAQGFHHERGETR